MSRSTKSLRVLLIFDLSETPPPDQDYTEYLREPDWKGDRALVRTLKKLGHDVKLFGIFNDIRPLIDELRENPPDLVFNTCEAVHKDREFEPNVVALLELLRIPYTGASSSSLQLCKDKGLSKKILKFHGIRVPEFEVVKRGESGSRLSSISCPVFIKPLGLEASEGISQVSLAESEKDYLGRIEFVHEKLKADAIVEEFIEGRELYVGVIGNERLTVFPPRELHFRKVPEGEPTFATYRAKWDSKYRKKWGIRTEVARGLDQSQLDEISRICKSTYRALMITGYARMDLRMSPSGEVVVIEANPNPSISQDEDFALAAEKFGMNYEKLLGRIVSLTGAGV